MGCIDKEIIAVMSCQELRPDGGTFSNLSFFQKDLHLHNENSCVGGRQQLKMMITKSQSWNETSVKLKGKLSVYIGFGSMRMRVNTDL